MLRASSGFFLTVLKWLSCALCLPRQDRSMNSINHTHLNGFCLVSHPMIVVHIPNDRAGFIDIEY